MATILVAVYRTIDDAEEVLRALAAEGVARDDVRISDYVDPVVTNAPASIEKPGGFLYWLGGIPKVDVEAYRQGIARGRTIVAVRTTEAQADRAAAVLERFNPFDVGDVETVPEAERVLAEETGAIARSGAPPAREGHAAELRPRLRRYVLPDSDER
jgi:hypothetical protein